jgi:Asp-tRNA(Asn)/Glu-tRNA(Gln) amidotransferase A subunit family amidase
LNRTLATPANTVAANLSGHPALVVPNGADHLGMPTSIQLIASHFAEEVLFAAGEVVQDGAR